jgi:hippurate hydrolase
MNAEIAADTPRLTAIFKDIHQHPELGFMETRTAAIVAKELNALGFEVDRDVGRTGVVGILRNGPGPTVMYRADMDANAVEEKTGLPYASKVRVRRGDGVEVPVAHMCGHDAHITWMLGMAKVMAVSKANWRGTLVLVAQPAEELGLGAKAMVEDGLYCKHRVPIPDFFIGLHTAPGPVGLVASAGGIRMAGSEQLDVVFHGVGGHGSMPQMTKDPVIMAALAVVQYQMITSRSLDPREAAVLTVGSIQAGTDNNVIPETSVLKITLRFFNPAVRERMIAGIRSINNGIAKAYGVAEAAMPSLTLRGGTTPVINNDALVARLNGALKALLGERNVVTELPATTGSEDVQMLLAEHTSVPFAYLLVGVADPSVFARALNEGKPVPYANHTPNFVVDLAAIPLGTKIATTIVAELLPKVPASSRAKP